MHSNPTCLAARCRCSAWRCPGSDISRPAIAALALGLGGVEDRPVAVETKAFVGRVADDGTAAALAEHAVQSVVAMEDHVAGAEFRLALSRELIRRVMPRAIADARLRVERLQ